MGVDQAVIENLCQLPESSYADIHTAIVQVRNLEGLRVLEDVKEDITRFQTSYIRLKPSRSV
jgi:hypothetical protein